jgi:hypothetical protein
VWLFDSEFSPSALIRHSLPQSEVPSLTTAHVHCSGAIASGFGITAGLFALYFFGEVPRVRKDILTKTPVVGGYWERSIPAEDNVRTVLSLLLFSLAIYKANLF